MSDSDPATPPRRPKHLDYEPADTLQIDTAERMKALGDPLRLLIVDLVLERAMSVTELAERVGRPRGSVAHHVKLLERAGLLQVVRTRKVRAIEERFYGRSATTYVMHHDSGKFPFLGEMLAEVDTERALSDGEATRVTYRRARIPSERAAEFGERLIQLSLEFVAEPRSGDTEYGVYLALFPTNRPAVPPATAGDPER